jgi:hypothetical protein
VSDRIAVLVCAGLLGGAACGEPEEGNAPPIGHSGGSVTVGGGSNATRTSNGDSDTDDDDTGDDDEEDETESANGADGGTDDGATDAGTADGTTGTATLDTGGTSLDDGTTFATSEPGETTFLTGVETGDATLDG